MPTHPQFGLGNPANLAEYIRRRGPMEMVEGGAEGEQKPSLWDRTLGNPDVQRLMAGIGSRMDPKGPGGYIGEPTIEMIESKAQQEFMEALMEKMGAGGGKIKIGADGSMTIDVNAVEPGQSGTRTKQYGMEQVGTETPKETGATAGMSQTGPPSLSQPGPFKLNLIEGISKIFNTRR